MSGKKALNSADHEPMYVIKRNGDHEEVKFDKITARIKALSGDLHGIDPAEVTFEVLNPKTFKSGIHTSQLDLNVANNCAAKLAKHPDFNTLASRLVVSNLYKNTSSSVYKTFKKLYEYVNDKTGLPSPLISKRTMDIVTKYRAELEALVDYDVNVRQYFGLKTLEASYLKKINGDVIERPQHALLRVAIGIRGDDLEGIKQSYRLMVAGYFTHASPTMFNAGTDNQHLSSCYLTGVYCNGTKTPDDVYEPGIIRDVREVITDDSDHGYSIDSSSDDNDDSNGSNGSNDSNGSNGTSRTISTNSLVEEQLQIESDGVNGDSVDGIYDTVKKSAKISQSAGGLGISVSNIRARGTYIRGTGGTSNGIVPMIRVFNNTASYIDQGGGKRPGAFVMYLEPWHADVFDFIKMRSKKTPEEFRAVDLFYGLWIPDLFMKRVQEGGDWTLMCPKECPGLDECYGDEFEAKYVAYEAAGKGRRTIKAEELWEAILESQFETGMPYMLAKDSANAKSNHQHMGTIKCSNLCCEIIEFTSRDEIAVCNLASIALTLFVKADASNKPFFDHQKLYDVTYHVTENLNLVIDIEDYPTNEAAYSNKRNRPIGLGVQGLADAFILMRMPFESDSASQLNKEIFETMYFAALSASCDLAAKQGPYASYEGSPFSRGLLQHDLWLGAKSRGDIPAEHPHETARWNWRELRAKIAKYGIRNSLLMAPMPTASTAQILGNNEGCEPFTSNIYKRDVLSGEFTIVNKYLQRDLIALGRWNDDLKDKIILNGGSVQGLPEIPKDLQELYKTVWEIKQKKIIDMAADRGVYIDQSQSMNLHVQDPNYAKLTTLYFHAWKRGLKTLQYYFRQQAKVNAQQFSIDAKRAEQLICSIKNRDACMMCSS